ncbi:MIP/aquaporin family protein [Microcoleus sp. F8-D3]|uniref:MIP family channel protein n=1 Tax=Phormidium nigroviride PCC 7112 TaxID=179408 RepID=K9VSF9_9CYAN|nr:MIP/aquaporin family protein [Oscillatoria nigro-viridis]AFZ10442.1 MIP family channel protein [Oscillatoria nigro-viridis PCC 7112]
MFKSISKTVRSLFSPECSREALAEFLGTFTIVFAGTGAVMVNKISQGAITHLGVSFVFGAVVAAMIYATGHISSAHLNPAVTLAFWASGFFVSKRVLPYILAQCAGAIAASTLLLITLGKVANLGATVPLNGNWLQSLILETVLTFILMFVILGSGLDRRAPIGFAGIAIGLTVGLEAAFMGPITGASMNPARSFGPAIVGGIGQHQWVYWVAPILGAQLAVLVYRIISDGFRDIK